MSEGTDLAGWLVEKTSGFFGARLSRRGFISRATIVGTAVAASGCAVITQQGPAITFVTDCAGGLCRDGYTEFCCVINNGVNACPPNTAAAGWWRADYSVYCNGTRYYIDCNNWSGEGGPCRCANGCGTRKVFCNHFRYGQCNGQIPGTGTIACRMVTCVPPYYLDIGCGASGAVDNATANHIADCAAYAPPAPPPPPPPVPAAPSIGTAITTGAGLLSVFVRVATNQVEQRSFNGSWSTATLAGDVASRVEAVVNGGVIDLFARSTTHAMLTQRFNGSWSGWQTLGGGITSDPVAVTVGSTISLFARGTDAAFYVNRFNGSTWSDWQTLGGGFSSDPTAVVLGSQIFLFGRGTDGKVYVNRDTGSWSGWVFLDGFLTSDPTAVAQGSQVYLFGRGYDNGLYTRTFTGSSWTPWDALGGPLTSEPMPVTDGSNVWVFARGSGNTVRYRRLSGSSWSAWAPIGTAAIASAPEPVADGANINVFGELGDASLGVIRYNGSTWDADWASVLPGGTLAPVNGTS